MLIITRVRFAGDVKGFEHIINVWCEIENLEQDSLVTAVLPREASVAFVVDQIKQRVPVFVLGPPLEEVEVFERDGRECIRTRGELTTSNGLLSLPTF